MMIPMKMTPKVTESEPTTMKRMASSVFLPPMKLVVVRTTHFSPSNLETSY